MSPSQRPIPDNTQYSQQTDIHDPQWDSNPQSQQASIHRPTPQTARPLGPVAATYRKNKFRLKLPRSHSTVYKSWWSDRRCLSSQYTFDTNGGPPCRLDDCLDIVYCVQHVGGNITPLRALLRASSWFISYNKTGELLKSVIADNC